MSYTVVFAPTVELPPQMRSRLGELASDIADAVSGIPPASAFWSSMQFRPLSLELLGWRIGYRIDRRTREIVIEEAVPLRRP